MVRIAGAAIWHCSAAFALAQPRGGGMGGEHEREDARSEKGRTQPTGFHSKSQRTMAGGAGAAAKKLHSGASPLHCRSAEIEMKSSCSFRCCSATPDRSGVAES